MEGESREKGREGAEGRRGAVRRGEARQPHGDTAFCSVCALVWHGKSPLLTSDGGPRVWMNVCVYVRAEWCWSQAGQREWLLGLFCFVTVRPA